MKRLQIAKTIATIATTCTVIGGLLRFFAINENMSNIFLYAACTLGCVSYFFGGIVNMMRYLKGFAVFGWYCAPPLYKMFTVLAAIFAGTVVFMFLPIIPVKKTYDEYMGS